jgi:predicted ABC-type ATPase
MPDSIPLYVIAGPNGAGKTTLSGRGYLSLFRELQTKGYRIDLSYLWLSNPQLAIQRVRDRVRNGGHSVPEEDIRRRFNRGLKNLFGDYLPLLDSWKLIDNSTRRPRMIAYGKAADIEVLDDTLFQQIRSDSEKL